MHWDNIKLIEHEKQYSKLSIYFVHTPGAEGCKIVHPAIWLCAQDYMLGIQIL